MITIQDDFHIGPGHPLAFILGPCVIETKQTMFEIAENLSHLRDTLGISIIFKASFDKANRTSCDSYRGPGLIKGLEMLLEIKNTFGFPVLTDVHTPEQAQKAAAVCDVLQIPAFLCRQTDLLVASGKTGAVINLKKGQFLAPWDMKYAVEKVRSTGNTKIFVTERGSTFGYNTLVTDMRSMPMLHESCGTPVCFDATHSVQLPGKSKETSGTPEYIPHLAQAAVAAGAHALFLETHPDPSSALSDKGSMLPLSQLSEVIGRTLKIHTAIHE